jgi:20S proteasome alpha/beta subunit
MNITAHGGSANLMAHFPPVNRRLINKQKSKNRLHQKSRMTCIISARCSDGVALIADRRIVDEKTRNVEYRDKLYPYYYPIIVGSSGDVDAFDSFRREALDAAQNIGPETRLLDEPYNYQISGRVNIMPAEEYMKLPVGKARINLFPYIEELRKIVIKYQKSGTFDIIFAAQTQEKGAFLEHIDEFGTPCDITDLYKIIGSSDVFANAILKPMWRKDMTMNEFAEFGYFIIKYFDRFEIDFKVGLGGRKPQVWFVPDDLEQKVREADPNTIKNYEAGSNLMLENITKYGFKSLLTRS